MKLSFSLPSKSSSKSSKPSLKFDQDQAAKEQSAEHHYVTEFDSSKALITAPKHVIPPKENTWRRQKKMRNIDLPIEDPSGPSSMEFELEDASAADKSDISYGLNVRSHINSDQKTPNNSIETIMLEKFRQDMKSLPDEQGLEEFEAVPIEGFGAALLAGYGWSEGKGIGRNAKEDVKVAQFERRVNREGLGFDSVENDNKKKNRMSDRSDTTALVAPKGPDGRTHDVVEKLVPHETQGIVVGKVVRVISGSHAGMKGKVVKKLNSDSKNSSVVLKLLKSEEEVSVELDKVADLGSVEEEMCLRKLQELDVNPKESSDRSNRKMRDEQKESRSKNKDSREESRREDSRREERKGEKRKDRRNREDERHKEDVRAPRTWLRSHIKVRVVSKTFMGGKFYLKKGEITDVVGPHTCDISMEESKELIQGVDQRILDTALPKKGGPVLVLFGEHKGVFGNLIKRNEDKETGIIRDADSQALLTVSLGQIAEYIGDPSYLGY